MDEWGEGDLCCWGRAISHCWEMSPEMLVQFVVLVVLADAQGWDHPRGMRPTCRKSCREVGDLETTQG